MSIADPSSVPAAPKKTPPASARRSSLPVTGAALAGLRMPVLVIHGEQDPIIRPKGGRSTARAIPGARLVTYPGMGHDLPRALWPAILEEISALAAQAEQAQPRPAGPPARR